MEATYVSEVKELDEHGEHLQTLIEHMEVQQDTLLLLNRELKHRQKAR